MRHTNKAARHSGNCERAIRQSSSRRPSSDILAYDVALGILGALVMVGVPLVMAALKSAGVW